VPVVTTLHAVGRARVAVELDGQPWRTFPAEAVARAGITAGSTLGREQARALRREVRELEARRASLSTLRYSDHTRASLRRRLEAKGIAPAAREAAVETMERSGLVDDRRFAHGRAALLCARASGDALIREDLRSRGVAPELVEEAVAALEPESDRAQRLIQAQGGGVRAVRRLAARGFAPDVLEDLIALSADAELG
jgi:regulatory protein